MCGGKALGWMVGTLIWMPGARQANISSRSAHLDVSHHLLRAPHKRHMVWSSVPQFRGRSASTIIMRRLLMRRAARCYC